MPSVGFDLGFARPANESQATTLTLQVRPRADQPALLIREVGEFNLQPAFLGPRPGAKDLQYQAGPVQHLGVPCALQVALLNRAEVRIRRSPVPPGGGNDTGELLHLARTHEVLPGASSAGSRERFRPHPDRSRAPAHRFLKLLPQAYGDAQGASASLPLRAILVPAWMTSAAVRSTGLDLKRFRPLSAGRGI